jgi:hypothetical protein
VLIALLITPAATFAESDSKTVQVSCTILPRLELSVTPETGGQIAFGAIEQPAPGDAASRSIRVALNVFSNLDRPYQVTQMIRRPLANPEGLAIAEEQFRVTTAGASRGQLDALQPTPLLPGIPTTLYTSDERGKSDAFSADYTLTVTPQTPAGEFGTEIVYTVTSL